MHDKNVINKIQEIYNEFTLKIDNLLNKRKELFKKYRQKLEETKIKEIKDSMSK